MQKFDYTSVDTIFAKFSRDLRGTDLHESDVIEWIGEALGFLKVSEIQEEAIAFIEVKNHKAEVPDGFQSVIQLAKYNNWTGPKDELSPCGIMTDLCNTDNTPVVTSPGNDCGCGTTNRQFVVTDCHGNIIEGEENVVYFRPHFDLKFLYQGWTGSNYYRNSYSPIRLANHSFFNSIVCTETDENIKKLYTQTLDEYTIVGGFPAREFRFSFKEGFVALSYLRAMIDPETGYPLIPDDISHITAIMYYIKWKLAERLRWDGREGFTQEAKEAEERWLKYVRQAINKVKMPHGVDQLQNMMEQSLYLIPRTRKYHGFFGSLGREEDKIFNNPNYKTSYGRY